MAIVKEVRLFFQEGNSDKVYNAFIVKEDDGTYSVNVEWGRRDAGFNLGKKAVHVAEAKAKQVFDRVVREKTNKGYQEITAAVQPADVAPPVGQGSGSKAPNAAKAKAKVGPAAQLLEALEEHELEAHLDSDVHLAQQKLDGIRVITTINDDGDIVPTNRNGEVTDKVAASVLAGLDMLPGGTVVDGEVMGDGYWLFDVLQFGDKDVRDLGYEQRWKILDDELAPGLSGDIDILRIAVDRADKRALFKRLVDSASEGIVFKTRAAPYTAGRSHVQRKFKLQKSADVVILSNAGNAYLMAVHHGPKLVEIGKVFAGTTNDTRAEMDELLAKGKQPVVEVRYLYATDDHQLFQPVFVRVRDDKPPRLCTRTQLKQTNKSVLT